VTAETVLRSPKQKQLGWVAIGLGIACAGYAVVWLGVSAGWILVGMGVFISVAFSAVIAVGRNALRLDAEGFTVVSLLRSVRYRWEDVLSFAVVRQPIFGIEAVVFELTPAAQSRNPIEARVEQAASGSDGGLPETYGMTALALCELLASHQVQSLGGTIEREEWASQK
jgi:Bacterial PH domain